MFSYLHCTARCSLQTAPRLLTATRTTAHGGSPNAARKANGIGPGVDSPAGHGDLHFGGRDAPTVGIEVTDRRRGLHFVHDVSLHVCRKRASSLSPVSPSERGEPTTENRSAAGERAGADTVRTNPQCGPLDGQQHGKFNGRLQQQGNGFDESGITCQDASVPTTPLFTRQRMSSSFAAAFEK